jgi:hypothetical protein
MFYLWYRAHLRQLLYLARLHELLEHDWFDLAVLEVVEIFFQIGLTVNAVVLVEPGTC